MNTDFSSMVVDHRPEILLNAVAYFHGNTRHCDTSKLFRLLNLLDFEHYRQTGWSVTGLIYHAFPEGPVPLELLDEVTEEVESKVSALSVREPSRAYAPRLKPEFAGAKDFDKTWFSLRELQIMDCLVRLFGKVDSDVMDVYFDDSRLPWKKVYGNGEGRGHMIPIELALQAEPVVCDEPTIEKEELLMLEEVFSGTGLH